MQRSVTRKAMASGLVALTVGAASACGDARINKLTAGITRDSALKVINEGAAGDSLARVYKQETYLINGKITNVLFYSKDGVKQASDSSLEAKAQLPIVTVAGRVTGWGWQYYDSVAKAQNFKPSPHP
jgi:hypothetical protein